MIPVWIVLGTILPLLWTWYLTVPVLIWDIGFILVDRVRHKRCGTDHGLQLLTSVSASLSQVNHQTCLLKNIFWWYQLPLTISISLFFIHVIWRCLVIAPPPSWSEFMLLGGVALLLLTILILLSKFVYDLNQTAVQTTLEPRQQELQALLSSLTEDDYER